MKLTHQPIKNDRQAVLVNDRIVELLDAPEGSPEFDERMTLEALVLTYEQFIPADGIEAPTFGEYLKAFGLKQVDIADYVGGASCASMLVSGKRRLTVSMMAMLHDHFRMPYDKLIRFALQVDVQETAAAS